MTRLRIHVQKTRKSWLGRNRHRYKKAAYGAEKNDLEGCVICLPIVMERLTNDKY